MLYTIGDKARYDSGLVVATAEKEPEPTPEPEPEPKSGTNQDNTQQDPAPSGSEDAQEGEAGPDAPVEGSVGDGAPVGSEGSAEEQGELLTKPDPEAPVAEDDETREVVSGPALMKWGRGVVNGEPYPGGIVFPNEGSARSWIVINQLKGYDVYRLDCDMAATYVHEDGTLRLKYDVPVLAL